MRVRVSLSVACLLTIEVMCGFGQRLSAQNTSTTAADILTDSEILCLESGGLAGRVEQAHFVTKGGEVTVEYRPAQSRPTGVTFTGLNEADRYRYLELWRDLERAGIWTMASTPKSRGADFVEYELRLRVGTRRHVVRWDDGQEMTDATRRAAEIARRILKTARAVAMEK